MGRREQDLDDDGPLAQFAGRLRGLRAAAGSPTYRQLASATNFSAATLARAASGRVLPTLDVTVAYAASCGADVEEWKRLWHQTSHAIVAERVKEEEIDGDAVGLGAGTGTREPDCLL